MKNKPLFIVILLAVFTASMLAGYFLPKLFLKTVEKAQPLELTQPPIMAESEALEDKRLSQPFIEPSVPQDLVDDFARRFAKLEVAVQSMYLPDDAFLTTANKSLHLSSFTGTPVLVNFWATWCLPCVVELPSLQEFAKLYEGRIRVVAISLEENKTPADIAAFLEMRGIAPDIAGYLDSRMVFYKKLGLRGVPTSFLLGSNGQILYRFEGDAEWAQPHATAFFDAFLLQKP